jgi:hypothetical protein
VTEGGGDVLQRRAGILETIDSSRHKIAPCRFLECIIRRRMEEKEEGNKDEGEDLQEVDFSNRLSRRIM